jgi:phage antirepressor YoqD-like protein
MNQLKTNEQTMSSREIAELTNKRHDNVCGDIRVMFAALFDALKKSNEAVPSVLIFQDTPQPYTHLQNGQIYYEYHLNREMTDLLLTGYSVILRLKVIRRWRELEAIVAPKLPTTFAEALRLAADQQDIIDAQKEQLTIAAPKTAFVDRYVTAKTGDLGFRQAAKLFGIKETVFRSWLIANRVLYMLGGEWAAYADHVTAGHVTTKVGEAIVSSHAYTQVKFTPKGVTWLAKKLGNAGLISS